MSEKKVHLKLAEELPIYRDTLMLATTFIQATYKFDRIFRYTIGEKIIDHLTDMFYLIQEIVISQTNKARNIESFVIKLNTIKTLIKICGESNQLSINKLAELSFLMENIGKQANGWRSKTLTDENGDKPFE